ncbi:hypothetical protein [Burkholderia glumae]|uniref:hypothetical protein n=1 Tax=Burkholderia glumae TaxID=337 RepID=UPI0012959D4D|nr:hypothetical protein [Burkholderia glumae]MCM2485699.1 hypothetical protein [Burkholderia glumae]MCM2511479.1 hypothetical protein [Burkholderia glumae]QGA41865.1 hypothetical protein GAS19_30845 [Burkholderia glumae]
MEQKKSFSSQILDFVQQQEESMGSPAAWRLGKLIRDAVADFRESGGINENAFCIDAKFEDGEFLVKVAFRENHNFTVMYQADTDNQIVEKIFQGDPAANDEVRRLAALMLAEGWIEGYAK